MAKRAFATGSSIRLTAPTPLRHVPVNGLGIDWAFLDGGMPVRIS